MWTKFELLNTNEAWSPKYRRKKFRKLYVCNT